MGRSSEVCCCGPASRRYRSTAAWHTVVRLANAGSATSSAHVVAGHGLVGFVNKRELFSFSSSTNDAGTDGVADTSADDQEVEFPHAELARLDEMINRPRWVVPVLQKGELEILLDASIALCKAGWHSLLLN